MRRMTCQKIARADELPLALTYDSWTANTNKQKLASLLSVIFLLVQQQNEMRKYFQPRETGVLLSQRPSSDNLVETEAMCMQELSESTEFQTSQMMS